MHDGLGEWCEQWLGSAIAQVLFEAGSLSAVTGMRLADGREVVVKVRRYAPRLNAAYLVQRHVRQRGYPAPEPLVPPVPLSAGDCASAEQLVAGGAIGGRGSGDAERSADALAWLLRLAPPIADVGDLSPAPPWAAWDHAGPGLWPASEHRANGHNAAAAPDWLEEASQRARERLGRYRAPRVIGHGDWHAENVRWSGNKLLVVHDWDSVLYQPEAVIAGMAAAIFPAFDACWQPSTVTESEAFLAAYLRARPGPWSQDDIEAFWAASLWTRAYDAMEESAGGSVTSLSQAEAQDRLARAGA
ncbi:MAG TPA: phosphotransferase [Streptosporangiaceae bacterium]|nr:phosphotransferase [Streptosporangiaceae bacterium]